MGIYQRLAIASILLAILIIYTLNPDPKQHQEEAIENGVLYLESQAEKAGFSGSLVSWGSTQLAEMAITAENFKSYALFSTAEIHVAGIKRGESFGCAGKVWIIWEEIESDETK